MEGCLTVIMNRNIEEFKSPLFWRAVFSEFAGTFLLIFLGCFSIIDWNPEAKNPPSLVQIALCFGLVITVLVSALGSVSGCNINPAVTLAMLITRKMCLGRAIVYMISQCLGAIAGARLLAQMIPEHLRGNVAAVELPKFVEPANAMLVEVFLTFMLLLSVFAACDEGKPEYRSSGPLMIGLSVTAGAFAAGGYTGGCMNPARALGPAVVANYWDHHWIYWCGPMLGGVIAALLYDLLFDTRASVRKFKNLLTNVSYDPNVASKSKVNVVDVQDGALEEVKPLNN